MSELRDRMVQDLKLAGLVDGTQREYLRAVRQLAAYYMIAPDRLSQRQVQDYILYVRDELGVAKGTFEPMFAGLKFFYVNTMGYRWALFTKKMVGRSREATGPYVDAGGKQMLEGGGTLVLERSDRWRGPGHNGVITTGAGQWMVHHTYDIQNLDAQRILQVRPMAWTKDGWPEVGEPVAVP